MNYENDIFKTRADDIFKVCCFYTLTRIKKYFGTLEKYFRSDKPTKALYFSFGKTLDISNTEHHHFNAIKPGFLSNVTKIKNKKHFKDILPLTGLIYHGKCDVKHKSGKMFSMRSWLEIPPEKLRELWSNEDAFDSTSSFYTKRQHKLIDKYILYKGKNNMTKEEKEQLKRECDEGKHAFPYDYLVKQIEKKERATAQAKATREKNKAAKQAKEATDIPPSIEDRFQEFIQKKYIGPNEAKLLYSGLNPDLLPPNYKTYDYIPEERNKAKLSDGKTPQQIIATAVANQFKQQNIKIKDKKLAARFLNLLHNLSIAQR